MGYGLGGNDGYDSDNEKHVVHEDFEKFSAETNALFSDGAIDTMINSVAAAASYASAPAAKK